MNCGKTAQEFCVAPGDSGDASLLEHNFGDPDAVGVAGLAPGESAAVLVVPGKEGGVECGGFHSPLVKPIVRGRAKGVFIAGGDSSPGGRADKTVRATRGVVFLRGSGAAGEQQVPLRLRRFGMTGFN